jgi:anti-sigma B factor antagonist
MKPGPFHLRADEEGVLWLSGELDLSQADTFTASAAALVNGNREVTLDCSELTFLDSSGIRAIFQLASRAESRVIIRNPTENVRKVFAIVGIDGQMGVRVEPSGP